MALQFLLLIPCLLLSSPFSLSSPPYNITKGSSLSVEKNKDLLISRNQDFSAGFYPVGKNAFSFSVWYTQQNDTIVWMANRDNPVNGKRSKLTLSDSGDLVLKDAGEIPFWSTGTTSTSSVHLQLNDTGNLVLQTLTGDVLWQSFDFPTDTLLPQQFFTKHSVLVSSRSRTNHSSGFYKVFFDDNNVIRNAFSGLEATSVYWPSPWQQPFEVGRTTYNKTRIAVLDFSGYFNSSDKWEFFAADYGMGPKRRLRIDSDGNFRLYSLDKTENTNWKVQWQAISQPCMIHGVCGANSLCDYKFGRRCSCIPGYKMKNQTDWSYGCEPDFMACQDGEKAGFVQLPQVEFYGYDNGYFENYTLERCKQECLKQCSCLGFQFKFEREKGFYLCYTKSMLFNGYQSTFFKDPMYIKLPRSVLNSSVKGTQDFHLSCPNEGLVQLERTYKKKGKNGLLKFMLCFSSAFGGFEIICILFFYYKTRQPLHKNTNLQIYQKVTTGFTRFTFAELKKASRNFSEEIGKGGGGVVYKAEFSDRGMAAIKMLNEAGKGEAEFQAEMSTIGKLNHMNLIEIWGFCAEGKNRLLVYEYMENGSLAKNLYSNSLDWNKRYEIAVGTAKGLAYLHDECLEWVLHCDVKPQNILLDSNYNPKVADFGLSKILKRSGIGNSSFSKIRGTRGYMAPEWVYNFPITSKVDVYSYGIVVLELITGRSPTGERAGDDEAGGVEQRRLVSWVREKMNANGAEGPISWIEEIVDPMMNGEYDMGRVKVLVQVAMRCVEEDRNDRPTMSQVVDILLHGEKDN